MSVLRPRRAVLREALWAVPRASAFALLLLLVSAATQILPAAGQREEAEQLRRLELLDELSLADETFEVAIAAVVAVPGRELDTPVSYARVLRDIATGPRTRYLDVEDRFRLGAARLARERQLLERAIEERRRAGERQALRSGSVGAAADQELARLTARRELLESIRPEEIEVPPELPIRVLEAAPVLREVLFDPAGLARRHPEADLIFWLAFEPLADLQLMTLQAWERSSGVSRVVFREGGRPDELGELIEQRERDVVAAMAGRRLGVLEIALADTSASGTADAEPADASDTADAAPADASDTADAAPADAADAARPATARAFLDGDYRGVLPLVSPYELPGSYELIVRLDDGREVRRQVVVREDDPTTVELQVTEAPPARVVIDSEPSGARVYRGSLWVGFAPVEVPRPRDTVPYTLVREGYYDSRVTLDAGAPERVTRTLVSRESDWPAEVRSARDRFYRSFGFFALSVGVPVLINGIYQNYNGLLDASGSGTFDDDLTRAEQERLLRQTNTLFIGYYAGLGLSAGLFGNMIWRLVDYVQTAQGYHTR